MLINNLMDIYLRILNDTIPIAPDFVTWDYTKYLCASSLLFSIGAIYAFSLKLYTYAILLLLTSIYSVNYWRKATYSLRRTVDVYNAKIMAYIFLFKALMTINNTYVLAFTLLLGTIAIWCFRISNKYRKVEHINHNWYKYHACFHSLATIIQCIVLYHIKLASI